MKKLLFLIILLLIITACGKPGINQPITNSKAVNNKGEQDMSQSILIVIPPGNFRDEEYAEPREIFDNAGFPVTIASKEAKEYTGMMGSKLTADIPLNEIKVNDYDAVVFIGGTGWEDYLTDQQFLTIAENFYNNDKVVAAICWAPSVLAKAGILKAKKATVWSGAKMDLIEGGAEYTGELVTIDGKIVTGNGPTAAKEFGQKVVEVLNQ